MKMLLRGEGTHARHLAVLGTLLALGAFLVAAGTLGTLRHSVERMPAPRVPEQLKTLLVWCGGERTEVPIERNTILIVFCNKCKHCKRELEALRSLRDAGVLERSNLSLLLISLDVGPPPFWESPIGDSRVRVLRDEHGRFLLDTFGRRGLPFVCYVMANGKIPYSRSGYRSSEFDAQKIHDVFDKQARQETRRNVN